MAGSPVSDHLPLDFKQNFCWSRTQFPGKKLNYLWKILDFGWCVPKLSENMVSPTFSRGHPDNPEFRAHLQLSENTVDYYPYYDFSVKACLELVSSHEVVVCYAVSLVDKDMKKVIKSEVTQPLECSGPNFFPIKLNLTKLNNIKSKSDLLLTNDTLSLLCELRILENSSSSDLKVISEQKGPIIFEVPGPSVTEALEQMFVEQNTGDVVLSLGDEEIKAHKCILISRSPVFAAMFHHETQEQIENRVEIDGLDKETIWEMLRFIYTDKTCKLEEMADQLLIAADRYGLDRLKAICEQALYKRVNAENAAELLSFAICYSAEQLKVHIENYVGLHSIAVDTLPKCDDLPKYDDDNNYEEVGMEEEDS